MILCIAIEGRFLRDPNTWSIIAHIIINILTRLPRVGWWAARPSSWGGPEWQARRIFNGKSTPRVHCLQTFSTFWQKVRLHSSRAGTVTYACTVIGPTTTNSLWRALQMCTGHTSVNILHSFVLYGLAYNQISIMPGARKSALNVCNLCSLLHTKVAPTCTCLRAIPQLLTHLGRVYVCARKLLCVAVQLGLILRVFTMAGTYGFFKQQNNNVCNFCSL